MAFGIHALNISRIVALLHSVHGTAGGTCSHQTTGQQTTTSPDGGTASTTECSSGCRTQRCADCRASDAAIHRRLISRGSAYLGRSKLLTDHIVVTKLFERQTGTGQYHGTGAIGQADATGNCQYRRGRKH
jgi:hypothetical protein